MVNRLRCVRLPFILLGILALTLNVVSAQSSATGGTLVVALSYAPKFLNVNYEFDGGNYFIVPNIMDKLIDVDTAFNLIPGLAETWEVSADGLQYTFRLAKGVKWHDGVPFTAADVVWTVESLIEDQGYGASAVAGVEAVEAVDDYTVVFRLGRVNSAFLQSLAVRYGFFILPKHLYEGTDPRTNPQNWAPIGTGPFKFEELVPGSSVSLIANEEYFRERPSLDRLIFRNFPNISSAVAALEAGEVGFLASSPAFAEGVRLRTEPGISVALVPSETAVWIAINMREAPLNDLRVRQAIGHAIDREQINQLVYQGLLTASDTVYISIIEGAWNPDATQPTFDVGTAEALLDEAGYPRGADGVRFKLRYAGFQASLWGAREIGEVLRANLARVGIDLQTEFYDFAVYADRIQKDHDYDLAWSGGPHGPDPSAFANFVATNGNRNVMGYSNPRVDELFALAASTAVVEDSNRYYQEIQQIISEELPRITLLEWSWMNPYLSKYSGFWWEEGSLGKVPKDNYWLVQQAR